jgi:hypothetical protein
MGDGAQSLSLHDLQDFPALGKLEPRSAPDHDDGLGREGEGDKVRDTARHDEAPDGTFF